MNADEIKDADFVENELAKCAAQARGRKAGVKTITIRFDGGCFPNPGNMYGSYEVRNHANDVILREERFKLGRGTNNMAEFLSLDKALEDLMEDMLKYGAKTSQNDVFVISDSKILLKRLHRNTIHKKPQWREASERMFRLADSCLKKLACFNDFESKWEPREKNVETFGH